MNKPNCNLAHTLLRRATLNPERTALVFEEREYSYQELGERVRKQATVLRQNNVNAGDRVAFLGFNQPAFLETLYATNAIGAIFVPLNFRLTANELLFIINDAGVHSIICDETMQAVLEPVRGELCCEHYYSTGDSTGNDLKGWKNMQAMLDASQPLSDVSEVEADDVSLIMYTSGTTGLPKGAMLTHGNIMWNNINAATSFGGTRDDIALTAAPLFHIGGLNVLTLHNFTMGGKLILVRNFDPGLVLELLARYQVTHMFGAPAMFLFMSQHPNFASTDLSHVQSFIVGAAPPPESLLLCYEQRGIQFCQGYGLTETSPFGTFLTPEWAMSKLGSAGQAAIYSDVKIVDADNQDVPLGEKGEICLIGPNVMKGYWNRPDATAQAIDQQGWFHTGDIGYFDQDRFLFICDRLKDMIISGGENVYPAEVESALYKHQAIAEVAVIGLPDEKWGEAVTAIVALQPEQSLTLEELRQFAEPLLARYKLPLRLHIVEALPRNPAGKVLKFKIKEDLMAS